jgi:hypothetical protein
MNATIVARTPDSFTLQVEVPYNGSMLDFEKPQSDDPQSDHLCIARRAGYDRRRGLACAGLVA